MGVSPSGPARPATGSGDVEPAEFFDRVHGHFLQAEQAVGGSTTRAFEIGGYTVALRFAGPPLIPSFTRAFQHLVLEDDARPDLTVCLWDPETTGTEMPELPWRFDAYLPQGGVPGYNDERFLTAVNPGIGELNMLDVERNLALLVIRDPQRVMFHHKVAPLLRILHWWLRSRDCQILHAGAVGNESGAVLITGKGGSGKSTSALACLHSDLSYLSDDYCILRNADGPWVHSLYNGGKLEPDSTHWFPDLEAHLTNDEKSLFYVHEVEPGKLVRSLPIRAILLPTVDGAAEIHVTPAAPMTAFTALVPSTLFQLQGAGEKSFRQMAALVKTVPCHTLHLGPEIKQIPEAIKALLAGE